MKKLILLLLMAVFLTGAEVRASLTEPVSKSGSDSSVSKELVMDDIVAMHALSEFKSLSRIERKMRISEAKKAVKAYRAQKAAGTQPSTDTLLLVILSILLPPLAVYLHEGSINGKFWLSLLLTLLFWLPGVIYALIVVLG